MSEAINEEVNETPETNAEPTESQTTQEGEQQEQADTTLEDVLVEIDLLKTRTESAEKARQKAESALTLERKAHAELKKEKRQQMTEAEQLEEYKKELEAKESELHRRMNRTAAREALAPLALSEKEMSDDDLELFVSSDEEKTISACQFICDLVKRRTDLARKDERDKIQQEMPTPPAGDAEKADDPFLQGFNAGYAGSK